MTIRNGKHLMTAVPGSAGMVVVALDGVIAEFDVREFGTWLMESLSLVPVEILGAATGEVVDRFWNAPITCMTNAAWPWAPAKP